MQPFVFEISILKVGLVIMHTLSLDEFLKRPCDFVLQPPKMFFWACYFMLVVAVCIGGTWPFFFDMQHSFGGYVSFGLSAVLLMVLCLPSSRNRAHLVNFAFDCDFVYVVNGYQKRVLALPRASVMRVNLRQTWGDYFAMLGFSVDVRLEPEELSDICVLLGVRKDDNLHLGDGIYRLGFSKNGYSSKTLYKHLAVLKDACRVGETPLAKV